MKARAAVFGSGLLLAAASVHAAAPVASPAAPWWVWPLGLFAVCFVVEV